MCQTDFNIPALILVGYLFVRIMFHFAKISGVHCDFSVYQKTICIPLLIMFTGRCVSFGSLFLDF